MLLTTSKLKGKKKGDSFWIIFFFFRWLLLFTKKFERKESLEANIRKPKKNEIYARFNQKENLKFESFKAKVALEVPIFLFACCKWNIKQKKKTTKSTIAGLFFFCLLCLEKLSSDCYALGDGSNGTHKRIGKRKRFWNCFDRSELSERRFSIQTQTKL